MSDNVIFNIILLFLILVMNIQKLQSLPAINQRDWYHQGQKVWNKKTYVNEINKSNFQYFKELPKNKHLLEQRKLQDEYKRDIYANDLLDEEKVFGKNKRRFGKRWWVQDDDNNEILLNNNFLNNVSDYWSYQKKYKNVAIKNYDDQLKYKKTNEFFMNQNCLTSNPNELNTQIHRRQVPLNDKLRLGNSSYPSVLTKAVEISLNTLNSPKSGGNLLANIAQKMNTSTLDLASKLAEPAEVADIKGFMKNNGNSVAFNALQNLRNTEVKQNYAENEGKFEDHSSATDLSRILQMILNKLDNIYDPNDKGEDEHPDGSPCDIIGSWSSSTLGLCFDIHLYNDKIRDISPAEFNNKILLINSKECTPAKKHAQLIDLQWKFKGSALKQLGGPFYMYGQKRSENIAATFIGFCRACGGIDTIFGSWNILSPSKDCNDISVAFDIKRDVLRRNLMETKRKERFKNVLYQNRLG